METVTETPAVESAPQESVSPEVSQTDYVNDAFGDYFVDPREEPQKAEPPKKEELQAQEPKLEEKEEITPKEGDSEGPEKKPDPFETAFVGESGDFDLEKLMGISTDGLNFQGEEKTEENGDGKDEKDDTPQWKRDFEQERIFRDNINKQRLGPLQDVFSEIEANTGIPDEIKEIVLDSIRNKYAAIKHENEQYFNDREQQRNYQKQQEHDEQVKEQIRVQKLPELARANAGMIISKLPGGDSKAQIELYNRIMFGPDAGGELLEDMFQAYHPDFTKKPKAELDRMMLRFVNELQADGKRLQRHFQRAFRYLQASPENMKRILSQVSRKTEEDVRGNALAAQKSPAGSVSRQPQAGNSMWGNYFADPGGVKTRI